MNAAGSIILSESTPFARGGTRLCFVHPHDPEKCIKVSQPGFDGESIRRNRSLWKRFGRGAEDFDQVLREARECEWLMRHDVQAFLRIPRYYGLCKTDLGPGIVFRRLRNADGSAPQTLEEKIAAGEPSVQSEADSLLKFLHDNLLLWNDCSLVHVLRVEEEIGHPHLYIIDGFGKGGRFSLAYYLMFYRRWKIKKRISKFEGRIAQAMKRGQD